jgi:hypothetical protein
MRASVSFVSKRLDNGTLRVDEKCFSCHTFKNKNGILFQAAINGGACLAVTLCATRRQPGFSLGVSPASRSLCWLGNELHALIESVREPV